MNRRSITFIILIACFTGAIYWYTHDEKIPQVERALRSDFETFIKENFPDAYHSRSEEFGVFTVGKDTKRDVLPSLLGANGVLLIHGLDEPGSIWDDLVSSFPFAGIEVYEFVYPNDQSIGKSSILLVQALEELSDRGVSNLWIVAHSMGGLLVRDVLHNPNYQASGWIHLGLFPNIIRVVMVGTPNQGSMWARFQTVSEIREQWERFLAGKFSFYDSLMDGAGVAYMDLLPDSPFIQQINKFPWNEKIPLTVIAGKMSPISTDYFDRITFEIQKKLGSNLNFITKDWNQSFAKLVNGLGDGVVSVESTYLAGLRDHVILEANHVSLLKSSGAEPAPSLDVIYDRILSDVENRYIP
jgi:pimeloyl-ACP methyl ester carboxylesterase